MPAIRTIVAAAVVGVGMGIYLQSWVGWPTYVAVAVGAVMAIVILLIASSLEDDADAADSAWRVASADLDRTVAAEPGEDDDGSPVEAAGTPHPPR
jgi:predicted MFS family arabinose efflux permease